MDYWRYKGAIYLSCCGDNTAEVHVLGEGYDVNAVGGHNAPTHELSNNPQHTKLIHLKEKVLAIDAKATTDLHYNTDPEV